MFDAVWYGGKCTYAAIHSCAKREKEVGVQIRLGIGGGKALDTAKVAADELGLPVFTLLAIAATCAAEHPATLQKVTKHVTNNNKSVFAYR